MNGLVGGAFIGFLSTPSARRATIAPPLRRRGVMISIHALREEGDRVAAAQFFFDFLFLSTPSARRATCCRRHRTGRRCISIHALREEGDNDNDMMDARVGISIHALREEGDVPCTTNRHSLCVISIHALREEGDASQAVLPYLASYFYPRPPRGGRPGAHRHSGRYDAISIHALREEGDYASRSLSLSVILFLSTPSARRATSSRKQAAWFRNYFYPRPPRGGRPPLWRSLRASAKISIHALREEGDSSIPSLQLSTSEFLSTPSARRATCTLWASVFLPVHFYPRPPRGGRPGFVPFYR